METIVKLPEITRLLDVTGQSERNVDNWENPCSLTFLARQLVRVVHINMTEEYYSVFNNEMDFCLDTLFL